MMRGTNGRSGTALLRGGLAQGGFQCTDIHWLGEMQIKAGGLAALDVAIHAIAAQGDGLAGWTQSPQFRHQVLSTAIGQSKVRQHQIEREGASHVARLPHRFCGGNLVAAVREQPCERVTGLVMIFDQQNTARGNLEWVPIRGRAWRGCAMSAHGAR